VEVKPTRHHPAHDQTFQYRWIESRQFEGESRQLSQQRLRSKEISGRVVREYVGGGMLGALAAKMDADGRAKIEQEARTWDSTRVRLEQAEDAARQLCDMTEVATRAVRVLAGYHLRSAQVTWASA
jgi:sulfite reductase beta subunit-like hemoprotein